MKLVGSLPGPAPRLPTKIIAIDRHANEPEEDADYEEEEETIDIDDEEPEEPEEEEEEEEEEEYEEEDDVETTPPPPPPPKKMKRAPKTKSSPAAVKAGKKLPRTSGTVAVKAKKSTGTKTKPVVHRKQK